MSESTLPSTERTVPPDPAAYAALRAPRVPWSIRAADTAVLLARHLLTLVTMPMFKQRTETAMDPAAFEIPLSGPERALVHRRLAGVEVPAVELEVPRLRLDDVSPEEVRALIRQTPVIFEGLAHQLGVLDAWRLDDLARDHRDAKFWVTNTDLTEFEGSLGDLLDEMLSGAETGKYVRGANDIFLEHPDLEASLPIATFRALIGELGNHFGTELFMGGPGTGSPFHCAPFFNGFTLIHGEKQWQFIHPSFTPWMYPLLHHTGFSMSRIDHRKDPATVAEKWPLYGRVNRMTATLTAGDVLINPPWWWHAVDNLSPSSIAVATRWAEPKLTRFNRRFELTSLLTPSAREVHREARRGARLTDAIWRERFNVKPPDRLLAKMTRK